MASIAKSLSVADVAQSFVDIGEITMKVIVFDTKPYDRKYLDKENERYGFEIKYIEGKLTPDTGSGL